MPRYFVCAQGPMGGVSIIFTADDRASCDQFINRYAESRGIEMFIYALEE